MWWCTNIAIFCIRTTARGSMLCLPTGCRIGRSGKYGSTAVGVRHYHKCHCITHVIANQCRNTGVALSKDSLRSQSVSPWLPLWGSYHEVTERGNKTLSAPTGHLSHRARQGPHPSRACVRRASHLPPREGFGERIATPVCGLVRNDMCFRVYLKTGNMRGGEGFSA